MKKILTLALLLICFSLSAQQKGYDSLHRFGRIKIKWSPLHFVDHYPTLLFGIEYRLTKTIALQGEFGPVVDLGSVRKTDTHKRGFKSKFQVRTYMPLGSSYWRFYIAPEVSYNKVDFNSGETFRVEQNYNPEYSPEYYQYLIFKRKYREGAIGVNFGAMFSVNRFCLDLQIGFAGRFIQYNNIDMPKEPEYEKIRNNNHGNSIFELRKDTRNVISPTAGLRLGYILLK